MTIRTRSLTQPNTCKYIISVFHFWIVLSTFFTTLGGILSLYGKSETGNCLFGVEIAATTSQGIAALSCVLALATAGWTAADETNPKKLFEYPICSLISIKNIKANGSDIAQTVILIIVNIVCLILVVIILINHGCDRLAYNAAYTIVGLAGSFVVTIIASTELQQLRGKPPDESQRQSQPSHAHLQYQHYYPATLSQHHYQHMRQFTRNPVKRFRVVIGTAGIH